MPNLSLARPRYKFDVHVRIAFGAWTRFYPVSHLVLFSLPRFFVKIQTKEMLTRTFDLSSPFSAVITYTEITLSSIQTDETPRRLRLAFNLTYCFMLSLWSCLCF